MPRHVAVLRFIEARISLPAGARPHLHHKILKQSCEPAAMAVPAKRDRVAGDHFPSACRGAANSDPPCTISAFSDHTFDPISIGLSSPGGGLAARVKLVDENYFSWSSTCNSVEAYVEALQSPPLQQQFANKLIHPFKWEAVFSSQASFLNYTISQLEKPSTRGAWLACESEDQLPSQKGRCSLLTNVANCSTPTMLDGHHVHLEITPATDSAPAYARQIWYD